MKSAEANKILEGLIAETEKSGIQADKFIPLLQKAREYALKEEDPLVTRALRLAWQHLESNEGFQLAFLEEAETQEENFGYFLNLCVKSDNQYNRDELREMTNMLQEMP
jgi:hypothetical protein